MGVEELLDLARVDVLAAADDHVLDPADDVDVALVVHRRRGRRCASSARRRSPRRSPPGRSSSRASPSSRACRARPARRARTRLAGRRVDDLDLDVRVHPADGADPLLERVVARRSGSRPARSRSCRSRSSPRPCASPTRTCFITSIGHGEPAMIPVRSAASGRSRPKSGSFELGDEHRRHAVERRAALGLGHGLERRAGSKASAGMTMQAPWRDDREVAEHHAEAVVERHRDADAVGGRVAAAPRR